MINKVIAVDFNMFMFRAIFVGGKNKSIPPTYTAVNMLLSCLKAIHCHPDDLIILALDSPKGSWRKEIDANYKANRREQREKHKDIDWKQSFKLFDDLLIRLDQTSPFYILKIDFYEADDIIAGACRFYKDRKLIILSGDSDYEMLSVYENVKIFSPKTKKYKEIKNPYNILANKIKKEVSDNLVTPIVTVEDYEKRKKIVNLIELPAEIERNVFKRLEQIKDKDYDLTKFPFTSLRNRFMKIYDEPKQYLFD